MQIFADTARSGYGAAWPLLLICRIFFVTWGTIGAIGFSGYAFRLWWIARGVNYSSSLLTHRLAIFLFNMACTPKQLSNPTAEHRLSWRGLAWPGVTWRDVAWPGVTWRGVAWPAASSICHREATAC